MCIQKYFKIQFKYINLKFVYLIYLRLSELAFWKEKKTFILKCTEVFFWQNLFLLAPNALILILTPFCMTPTEIIFLKIKDAVKEAQPSRLSRSREFLFSQQAKPKAN